MNGGLSKFHSFHTYVMHRMFYFERYCIWIVKPYLNSIVTHLSILRKTIWKYFHLKFVLILNGIFSVSSSFQKIWSNWLVWATTLTHLTMHSSMKMSKINKSIFFHLAKIEQAHFCQKAIVFAPCYFWVLPCGKLLNDDQRQLTHRVCLRSAFALGVCAHSICAQNLMCMANPCLLSPATAAAAFGSSWCLGSLIFSPQ